jgi:sialate O-acetylesterase
METPMARLVDDFPEQWQTPNERIRQFDVPRNWDFSAPRRDLSGGTWRVPSPETLGAFAATPWFFANDRFARHGLPVGLLQAAWGGAPVEAFMSRQALRAFPETEPLCARFTGNASAETMQAACAAAAADWDQMTAAKDRGRAENWHSEAFDDSAWPSVDMPDDFARAPELAGFCGVLWLRREITVPPECAGADCALWLGTITDADTVFWNGHAAGETGYRYPPRKYCLPGSLVRAGKNLVALRVVCRNGDGGITPDKPFTLFPRAPLRGRPPTRGLPLAGAWKYRPGFTAAAPRPPEFFPQWQPSGIFNGMIAPLLRVPAHGVLWYQGESNTAPPACRRYAALFSAMISDWRRRAAEAAGDPLPTAGGPLPFVFTQLPLFGPPGDNAEDSGWALVRRAQEEALALPATAMAAALDLGEWNDLHPINKKDVGGRLALAAAALLDGERNASPGPQVAGVTREDGAVVIRFTNCADGLRARGPLTLTLLWGGERRELTAEITGGDSLRVPAPAVADGVLLYAWADNPKSRGLYNSAGLPALPFRLELPSGAGG